VDELKEKMHGDFICSGAMESPTLFATRPRLIAPNVLGPQRSLARTGRTRQAAGAWKTTGRARRKNGTDPRKGSGHEKELEKLQATLRDLIPTTMEQIGQIQSEIGELQSKIGDIQSKPRSAIKGG